MSGPRTPPSVPSRPGAGFRRDVPGPSSGRLGGARRVWGPPPGPGGARGQGRRSAAGRRPEYLTRGLGVKSDQLERLAVTPARRRVPPAGLDPGPPPAPGARRPRPGAQGPGLRLSRRSSRPGPNMLDGLKMEESFQSAIETSASLSSLLGECSPRAGRPALRSPGRASSPGAWAPGPRPAPPWAEPRPPAGPWGLPPGRSRPRPSARTPNPQARPGARDGVGRAGDGKLPLGFQSPAGRRLPDAALLAARPGRPGGRRPAGPARPERRRGSAGARAARDSPAPRGPRAALINWSRSRPPPPSPSQRPRGAARGPRQGVRGRPGAEARASPRPADPGALRFGERGW